MLLFALEVFVLARQERMESFPPSFVAPPDDRDKEAADEKPQGVSYPINLSDAEPRCQQHQRGQTDEKDPDQYPTLAAPEEIQQQKRHDELVVEGTFPGQYQAPHAQN